MPRRVSAHVFWPMPHNVEAGAYERTWLWWVLLSLSLLAAIFLSPGITGGLR